MKQIHGITANINLDILGRITFKRHILHKEDYIFLIKDSQEGVPGYAAIISNQRLIKGKYPIVGGVDFNNFQEGDVVLINQDGLITFLYERLAINGNAIFVTGKCNHRCIMCPQPPILEEKDKTPLNMKLIRLMDKHTKELGITGGEPTLIGQKLFDIIKCIQKHLPESGINVLSNGVRFSNREYAKGLALCQHNNLQIDIPIYSDIAIEHNRIVGANTFYKTVQGLYNLALFHQKIGIRIVIHKQNYKRLPLIAEYIYRNFPFVCQVAFLQMETIGISEERMNELWIDPHDYNNELKESIHILECRGMHPYIYNAQLCVLPQDIRAFAVKSISDWKDSYLEECRNCSIRENCGGVFLTNKNQLSKYISKQ